jgi:hypothetical protein
MTKSQTPTRLSPTGPAARDSQHDRRTELVKEMVAKENAALDAKTARLRALRLAKEAEDRAAGGEPPAKPLKPRAKVKRINAS